MPLRGGGYLEIYARRQSLQEAKRTKEQVVEETQEEIRKVQARHGIAVSYFNMLLAIRTDTGINDLPAADEYLSHFVEQGWRIESLVILGEADRDHDKYHAFGAPTLEHYGTSDMVVDDKTSEYHWLTGPVRNHFGWA